MEYWIKYEVLTSSSTLVFPMILVFLLLWLLCSHYGSVYGFQISEWLLRRHEGNYRRRFAFDPSRLAGTVGKMRAIIRWEIACPGTVQHPWIFSSRLHSMFLVPFTSRIGLSATGGIYFCTTLNGLHNKRPNGDKTQRHCRLFVFFSSLCPFLECVLELGFAGNSGRVAYHCVVWDSWQIWWEFPYVWQST